MRIPFTIPEKAIDWLSQRGARNPYIHLEGYMNRYWILRPKGMKGLDTKGSRGIGIRLHEILSSDNDRHLHDHPWWNISIILKGEYIEEMPVHPDQHPTFDEEREGTRNYTRFVLRRPGDIVFRKASSRHRIILLAPRPVLSLFIFGPWTQVWGFYTSKGKIPWDQYPQGNSD